MHPKSSSEESLEAALVDYLTRMDAGERPDPEEYLRGYPRHAAELREFFNDLEFVDVSIAEARTSSQSVGLGRWFAEQEGATEAQSSAGDGPTPLPSIKGFKILEELGSGSQGVVYRAIQLGTGRTVALKVIREGIFASKRERRRFEREVEVASRLDHPNVVAIYECGQDLGRDYFAMAYVDGAPLDTFVSTHRAGLRAIIELFLQVCDGVSYAHQHGVIHRDLKPSNILVDSCGRAHILDFGLAKVIPDEFVGARSALTEVGGFAGTWCYSSPEQVSNDSALVDVRSDVYTLGVILYEMLTGNCPYPIRSASRDAIIKHIRETPPSRPSSTRRDLDDDVDTIILRTLDKEPDRRYQSTAALAEDIERYLAGEAIEAKRDSSWYVLRKTLRRHRWRVAAFATVLVSVLAFAVTVSILYSRAVSAWATTELRSEKVRGFQAYTLDKLDELNLASNVLAEIAEAHPELPEVRRLRKAVHHDHLSLFEPAVAGMPEGIVEAMLSQHDPQFRRARGWLNARDDELDEIETTARAQRFVFHVQHLSDFNVTLWDHPGNVGLALEVCEAFVARALREYHHGDHESAIAALSAARSIALDLGYGRLIHQKGMAVAARSQVYDALLAILSDVGVQEPVLGPYIDWTLHDPPLPQYRLGLITARQQRAQSLEGSFAKTQPDGNVYLDSGRWETLSAGVFGGFDDQNDASLPIAPDAVLTALDFYMSEVEEWDSLTFSELDERTKLARSRLVDSFPSGAVRGLFTSFRPAFEGRARIRAKRYATILAAYLRRYRGEFGRWPATLRESIPDNARIKLIDPYTGAKFGYKLVRGGPLLYSINEDGVDNEGTHGKWGEAGTDVVLFPPPHR